MWELFHTLFCPHDGLIKLFILGLTNCDLYGTISLIVGQAVQTLRRLYEGIMSVGR
jgi:hypothetical protein